MRRVDGDREIFVLVIDGSQGRIFPYPHLPAPSSSGSVVSHVTSLGFNLNFENNDLVPSQWTIFLGVVLDSTTPMARLSQERIDNILTCVMTFHVRVWVPYKACMRVAGFMASAIHLACLGRLYMRPFQRWMLSLRILSSQCSQMVQVTGAWAQPQRPWQNTALLGVNLSYRVITTDAMSLCDGVPSTRA